MGPNLLSIFSPFAASGTITSGGSGTGTGTGTGGTYSAVSFPIIVPACATLGNYAPGETLYAEFVVLKSDTGALVNVTGTPLVTMTQNGVLDTSFTYSITSLGLGHFVAIIQIPSRYSAGDTLGVAVTTTAVNGIGVAVGSTTSIVASIRLIAGHAGKVTLDSTEYQALTHSLMTYALENGVSFQQMMRGIGAALLGSNKNPGAFPTIFAAVGNPTTNRLAVNQNRTALSLTLGD